MTGRGWRPGGMGEAGGLLAQVAVLTVLPSVPDWMSLLRTARIDGHDWLGRLPDWLFGSV